MSLPNTSCCASALNQQQDEVIQHHQQCSDSVPTPCQNLTGMQTVIEKGRVVVRPMAPAPTQPEES